MKEFEDFIKLYLSQTDEPLAKDEQEKLFRELSEIKKRYGIESEIYKDKRKTIINHNLRLCANFAINYAKARNLIKDIQDINSQCIVFMVSVIDNFDIDRGTEFSTYLYSSLDGLFSNYYKALRKDAINYSDGEIVFTDHKDETSVRSIFDILPDYSESFVAEEMAGKDFESVIINLINNISNKRNRKIFKMYMGLGYDRKYQLNELGEIFQLSRETLCTVISQEKDRIIRYISKNYPETMIAFNKKNTENKNYNLQFGSKEDKLLYMVYSYYGYLLPQKKAITIALELDMAPKHVRQKINDYMKKLSSEEREKIIKSRNLQKNDSEQKLTEEIKSKIFNSYFGLNGEDVYFDEEIIAKYNLTKEYLEIIINEYKNKYISKGLYKTKEFEDFCFEKNLKLAKKYGYEFFSYYGYSGFDKKSKLDLCVELNISIDDVSTRIENFNNYISQLPYEQREKLIKVIHSIREKT